jgi:hypothetical protein
MDACLYTMTHAKLEDLANQFRQSHADVLRQVMSWGLSRKLSGQIDRNDG